jgi:hypothetical protein
VLELSTFRRQVKCFGGEAGLLLQFKLGFSKLGQNHSLLIPPSNSQIADTILINFVSSFSVLKVDPTEQSIIDAMDPDSRLAYFL